MTKQPGGITEKMTPLKRNLSHCTETLGKLSKDESHTNQRLHPDQAAEYGNTVTWHIAQFALTLQNHWENCEGEVKATVEIPGY